MLIVAGDTDAMNEAAWCYLEGFGGKKDKVSASVELALRALVPSPRTSKLDCSTSSSNNSFKNGHSELYCRAACVTDELWMMQACLLCIGTIFSGCHNAIATDMHVNAILQKQDSRYRGLLTSNLAYQISRFQGSPQIRLERTQYSPSPMAASFFGHQCMSEWRFSSSLRRACTLH